MSNGAKTPYSRKSGEGVQGYVGRMIDRKTLAESVRENMTPDEARAFTICFGGSMPEGKYTRAWAIKTVRQFAESDITGKMALFAMGSFDLNQIMDIADFLVPKAARVSEEGSIQEEFSITITKKPMEAGDA